VVGQAVSPAFRELIGLFPQPASRETILARAIMQKSGESFRRDRSLYLVCSLWASSKRNPAMSRRSRETENDQSSAYRQILLDKRASALAGLGVKANQLASTGRIGEEDQAQYSLEEAVSIKLNGIEYIQLRQIQEALDRLQTGEYGTCLFCEEPIPPKRLNALPWAKYCVKCQERVAGESLDNHPIVQ
jgi:DnaK suppressor protein